MKCASAELAPLGARIDPICSGVTDTSTSGLFHTQNQVLASPPGAHRPTGHVDSAVQIEKIVVFLTGATCFSTTRSLTPVDRGMGGVFGRFTKEPWCAAGSDAQARRLETP
jgi:hypothetical protein